MELGPASGVIVAIAQVTMRLENPVIYFYPPKDQTVPLELDVRVELVNGWLSEFYPAILFG